VYYPSGAYASDVTNKIVQAEEFLSRYGASGPPPSAAPESPRTAVAAAPATAPSAGGAATGEMSDMAKQYYNAVSLVSQEKYMEAFKAFKKIIDGGADQEYASKTEFEMAKCLFYLKQFDSCIKSFTAIVQKFPKHPEMKDALFFVGRSYEEKGEKAKAGGLFKKIMTMGTDEDPVVRKARKALRVLEGEKV
jgi:TolA-binding protein